MVLKFLTCCVKQERAESLFLRENNMQSTIKSSVKHIAKLFQYHPFLALDNLYRLPSAVLKGLVSKHIVLFSFD